MSLEIFKRRVLDDRTTLVSECPVITKQEIVNDRYLKSAFYFKNNDIRVITAASLINNKINGREYPIVVRNQDLAAYAYDFIIKEGRVLAFIQETVDYVVLMSMREKKFISVGFGRQIPFGIDNFVNPKENALGIKEPYKYGVPILIVEGLRDCLDAQGIYPYTVAMQTAAISVMTKEVLKTLTGTLILALDNDETGIKSTKRIIKDRDFEYMTFNYPSGYKDIGMLSELYLRDDFRYSYYKEYIKSGINILVGGRIGVNTDSKTTNI